MKWIKIITMLIGFAASSARGSETGLSIYYFPFNSYTDRPINFKNINDQAIIVVKLRSNYNKNLFTSLINRLGTYPIDKNNIRLKLVMDNNVYIFDKKGNGVDGGGKKITVDIKKFESYISEKGISILNE